MQEFGAPWERSGRERESSCAATGLRPVRTSFNMPFATDSAMPGNETIGACLTKDTAACASAYCVDLSCIEMGSS